MYESVLQACLDEQDGSSQSWQQFGVTDLLLHLQRELRFSERMDQLARARVLLLRCARLSELERKMRGTCRVARREQEVLSEVQQIRTLLLAAGGGRRTTGWAEEEERTYAEKVWRDIGDFCRDVLEDYHEYIESGASRVWECLARLLAMSEGPQCTQPESDATDLSGGDEDGSMAPPPVIHGSADLDEVAAVKNHEEGGETESTDVDETILAMVAAQCITAGVQRVYMEGEHIAAADFDSNASFGELGCIADAVVGQLTDEAEHSVPFFASVHPDALCSIARALADAVRGHYRKCCLVEEDNARRYARLLNAASGDVGESAAGDDSTFGGGDDESLHPPQGTTEEHAARSTMLTLTPEVVHCIKSLHALDEQLLACGLQKEETLLGYKVNEVGGAAAIEENRFPGLVDIWLDEKRQQFDDFVSRCIELEEECHWTPVLQSDSPSGDGNQGAPVIYESSSVLDLFALFSQAVDSFLEMELPPWEAAFLSLLEHVVGAAIAYANRLHESCLPLIQQAVPPPRPRLKRPCRDERAGAPRGGVAVLAAGALRLASAGGIALPRQGADASEEDSASQNLQSIVIRLNNVDYGARQFKSLWSRVAKKWSAAAGEIVDDVAESFSRSAPDFLGMTSHGSRRLDAMLGGMENSYRTTADELAAAVARVILYGEHSPVRGAILDGLYLQGDTLAESNRVDAVLCALIEETVVGDDSALTQSLSPSLAPQVAREVRLTVLSCYEHILLDGGAGRIFAPDDSQLLKEDYLSLLVTFAQLQAEAEEIAIQSEKEFGGHSLAAGSSGGGSGSNREDDLRKALGPGGLDACVCSRRVECHRVTDHSSGSVPRLATPATVFCVDCSCALYCAACSAALHVGGYTDHEPWTFGEPREQARAHGLLELMGMSSAALVSRLRAETSLAGPNRGKVGQAGSYGKKQPHYNHHQTVYAVDIARILAHRDDADALAYMRQTVTNYDTCGGVWDPMTGLTTTAPSTQSRIPVSGAAPSTPPGAASAGETEREQQGRRGSGGSGLASWSPGSVGSLLGDVGRAMRR